MSASGIIDLSAIVLIFATLVASYTDLRAGKIPNWLTFSMMASGVFFQVLVSQGQGLQNALAGIGTALLLTGGLFLLRALGAGDAKLLMGIGAWTQPSFVFDVAVVALLLGGCGAVLSLLWRGKLFGFAVRLRIFLSSVSAHPLGRQRLEIDVTQKMPFGPFIAAAVVVVYGKSLW